LARSGDAVTSTANSAKRITFMRAFLIVAG
jgi:hypothetical protein